MRPLVVEVSLCGPTRACARGIAGCYSAIRVTAISADVVASGCITGSTIAVATSGHR
jgi:hypothetical protein